MTRHSNSYTVEIRDTKIEIIGPVYPAEPDVGIMGPYIEIEEIKYEDGSPCDWEITDDEMDDIYRQLDDMGRDDF